MTNDSLASPSSAAAGPSVSLVLGSGGARGYAHIGVIEVLLEAGYRIHSIAGSSMGALIGGVYAAGKLKEYREWVVALERMDVLRLVDWTFSGGGLIKGDRIIGVLRELIGDRNIESLPISYTAVATDIDREREVWLSRGSLFDAIRASIAIPMLFRPHHYLGRILVDGGLINPLPITPTLRDLSDYTIAVNLNGAEGGESAPTPAPEQLTPNGESGYRQRIAAYLDGLFGHNDNPVANGQEPGLRELVARSLETMQGTIARLKLAAHEPDLLISIPRDCGAFYEFHRAAELIGLGRQRTEAALRDWRRR